MVQGIKSCYLLEVMFDIATESETKENKLISIIHLLEKESCQVQNKFKLQYSHFFIIIWGGAVTLQYFVWFFIILFLSV